jgi:hypothetical protein
MPRKFIQITSTQYINDLIITALCDDGTVWISMNNKKFKYHSSAPQDIINDEIINKMDSKSSAKVNNIFLAKNKSYRSKSPSQKDLL